MGNWYHCSVQTISRSGGKSVVAAAAYRAGVQLDDERNGRSCDYSRKQGVAAAFIVTPDDAPDQLASRQQLWNAAESAEGRRGNACTGREMTLALPAECSEQQRQQIARDMAGHLAERYGVAVDVAVHRPGRDGDRRNHHAHLMFTSRQVDGSTQSGLGKKTRSLDDRKTGPQEIERIHAYAAEAINREMARTAEAKAEDRVDHRSFERRGIQATPTVHEGPNVRHAARKAQQAGQDWQPKKQAPARQPAGDNRAAKAERIHYYRQTARPAFNTAVRAQRQQQDLSRPSPGHEPGRAADSATRDARIIANRAPQPAPRPKPRGRGGDAMSAVIADVWRAQARAGHARVQPPPGQHVQDRPSARPDFEAASARDPLERAQRMQARRAELRDQRAREMDRLKARQWDERGNLRNQQDMRDGERQKRLAVKRDALRKRIDREQERERAANRGVKGLWRRLTGKQRDFTGLQAELDRTRQELDRIEMRQGKELRDLDRKHEQQRRDLGARYDRQERRIDRVLDRLQERNPELELERSQQQRHPGGGRTRERGSWSPPD